MDLPWERGQQASGKASMRDGGEGTHGDVHKGVQCSVGKGGEAMRHGGNI